MSDHLKVGALIHIFTGFHAPLKACQRPITRPQEPMCAPVMWWCQKPHCWVHWCVNPSWGADCWSIKELKPVPGLICPSICPPASPVWYCTSGSRGGTLGAPSLPLMAADLWFFYSQNANFSLLASNFKHYFNRNIKITKTR